MKFGNMPQECRDLVYSFWSPSKEIEHRIKLNTAFHAVIQASQHMSEPSARYYMLEVEILEPDGFRTWVKRAAYQQFILLFTTLMDYENKSFSEALDMIRNDRTWYMLAP